MPRALSPRWAYAAAFVAALAFYVFTLQPSLAWGDGVRLQREAITGESYILAEMVQADFAPDPFPFARVGVAAWDHPLYIILTHLAVRALPAVPSLWLVNLASAVFAALTVLFVGLLIHDHTRSLPAGLLSAASLAVSHTFWFHAVTPEVYSLVSCLLVLAAWAWLRSGGPRGRAWLVLAAVAFGLAASTHLLALLALPALAIYYVLARLPQRPAPAPVGSQAPSAMVAEPPTGPARWGWHSFAFASLGFLLGFAPYLIQLLRMLRTFTLSEVMGPVTGATFFSNLAGSALSTLPLSTLTLALFLVLQFSPLGAALGVIGLWRGGRVSPALWRLAGAGFAVFGLFGVLYRVADQFAFFQPAYLFFTLLLGLGLAESLSRWPRHRARLLLATALATAALPVVYALAPRLANAAGLGDDALGIPVVGTGVRNGLAYYVNPNKRGDFSPDRFGLETLAALPPNALVLAQWYTDTDEYYILRYLVAVEGRRPDVVIEGWPTVDAFTFDSALAVQLVADSISTRPVYLASLSEDFYAFSTLAARYCIVEEGTLYRILPEQGDQPACLGR